MLPLGTRPLVDIKIEKDPLNRVQYAATLLEYLLRTIDPETMGTDGKPIMLGERVQRNQDRFPDVGDVLFGLRIRNDIVHSRDRQRPLDEAEVERAGMRLIEGIEHLLPAVPHATHQLVVSGNDPEGRPRAKRRRKFLLVVGAVLVALTLWFVSGGHLPVVSGLVYGEPAQDALRTANSKMRACSRIAAQPGLAAQLKRAAELHDELRGLVEAGRYRKALDVSASLGSACAQIQTSDQERSVAKGFLREAQRERTKAQAKSAAKYEIAAWFAAEQGLEKAKKAFVGGAFVSAGELAKIANKSYVAAAVDAGHAAAAAVLRADYERLVTDIGSDRLSKHGGQGWQDASASARKGAGMIINGQHRPAAAAYQKAMSALRGLVSRTLLNAVDAEGDANASLSILQVLLRIKPDHAEASKLFDEYARSRAAWWIGRADECVAKAGAGRPAALAAMHGELALARFLSSLGGHAQSLEAAAEVAKTIEKTADLVPVARDLAWICLATQDDQRCRRWIVTMDRALVGLTDRSARARACADLAALSFAVGDREQWQQKRESAKGLVFQGHFADGAIGAINAMGEVGDLKHAREEARHCGRWKSAALARIALHAACWQKDDVYNECRRLCMDDVMQQHLYVKSMAYGALATADALYGRIEEAERQLAAVSEAKDRAEPWLAIATGRARQGSLDAAIAAIAKIEPAVLRLRAVALVAREYAANHGKQLFRLLQWGEQSVEPTHGALVLAGAAQGLLLQEQDPDRASQLGKSRPRLRRLRAEHEAVTRTAFEKLAKHIPLGKVLSGKTVYRYPVTLSVKFTTLHAPDNTIDGTVEWVRSDRVRESRKFTGEFQDGRILIRETVGGKSWDLLRYELSLDTERKALVGTWTGREFANQAMSIQLR